MAESKGLAIVALALGILGLFTLGGFGVGSLLGLALAGAALASARAGRDVAWAAVAANLFALLTVFPLGTALWAHREGLVAFVTQDYPLPEPAQTPVLESVSPAAFPPPPPPAPRPSPRAASKDVARQAEEAPAVVPIRVGGEIREPRKTRHVNPVYPRDAIASRIQGVVILECTISPQGKVVAVKSLRSVPMLDEAAIQAVKQWEYTPTLLDGVAVPVIMTVTVNFKLS
jgi:TonB family protein